MQARYYDPVIGRFLSVDPVGFMQTGAPQQFNRYAYTWNDPINKTDPDGRYCLPCIPPVITATEAAIVTFGAVLTYVVLRDSLENMSGLPNTSPFPNSPTSAFPERTSTNEVEARSHPTPDKKADGKPHSTLDPDGGYTTFGPDGKPEKAYRPDAKQPDGSRGENVKEWPTHTDPETGEEHTGKPEKRDPEPEERRPQ